MDPTTMAEEAPDSEPTAEQPTGKMKICLVPNEDGTCKVYKEPISEAPEGMDSLHECENIEQGMLEVLRLYKASMPSNSEHADMMAGAKEDGYTGKDEAY